MAETRVRGGWGGGARELWNNIRCRKSNDQVWLDETSPVALKGGVKRSWNCSGENHIWCCATRARDLKFRCKQLLKTWCHLCGKTWDVETRADLNGVCDWQGDVRVLLLVSVTTADSPPHPTHLRKARFLRWNINLKWTNPRLDSKVEEVKPFAVLLCNDLGWGVPERVSLVLNIQNSMGKKGTSAGTTEILWYYHGYKCMNLKV